MFGKKKEITQKFIGKSEEELEDFSTNEPKKEKNLQHKDSDNNFIFYGSNNKFTKQLEIYAKLKDPKISNEINNPKNKKLVLVVVDSDSPMELLSYKICESFGQFPEYQNLEGLTATNLTKMDEEKKNLPSEGKVGDVLRNGDIIYVDLISNEIWIKTYISMSSAINKNVRYNISMDVKVKTQISFRDLRYKLLKCGIMCFMDKFSKSTNNFHYIVSEFSMSSSVHGQIEDNKLKTFDLMKVGQLFNFKNNIKIQIKFYPIEFVLFQKLKAIPRPKKEKTNKRKALWDKFKILRFRDLLYNKRYIKEKEYIFNFIKNLFINRGLLSKCYIYSIDDDYYTSVTEDVYEETKYGGGEDERELSILNINNINGETENSTEQPDLENDSKRNKSIYQGNSLFNKAVRSKTSLTISSSFSEDIKCTLIVLPPNNLEDDNRMSIKSKIYSTKKFDFRNELTKKESEEEECTDDDNEIFIQQKRKNSFFNKKNVMKKQYTNLDFEVIDKPNNTLEKDEELIIYKDLKPKEIVKEPKRLQNNIWEYHNKINLCKDFDKYFDKEKFIDFISELFLMNIQKGALERSTIPNFRGFKVIEKKNRSLNGKKRKKKKFRGNREYYTFVFPVKRLNFEIGIFVIFIFSIFVYFSYLFSNTYY